MSEIPVAYSSFECDTPGCPSEFSITRHRLDDEGTDDILIHELLVYAAKLGWKVEGAKAFCTDCIREGRA
jgi:hypothetical protein